MAAHADEACDISTVPKPEPGFMTGRRVLLFVLKSGTSPALQQHGWHTGHMVADAKGGHLVVTNSPSPEFAKTVQASHWAELPPDP